MGARLLVSEHVHLEFARRQTVKGQNYSTYLVLRTIFCARSSSAGHRRGPLRGHIRNDSLLPVRFHGRLHTSVEHVPYAAIIALDPTDGTRQAAQDIQGM